MRLVVTVADLTFELNWVNSWMDALGMKPMRLNTRLRLLNACNR